MMKMKIKMKVILMRSIIEKRKKQKSSRKNTGEQFQSILMILRFFELFGDFGCFKDFMCHELHQFLKKENFLFCFLYCDNVINDVLVSDQRIETTTWPGDYPFSADIRIVQNTANNSWVPFINVPRIKIEFSCPKSSEIRK